MVFKVNKGGVRTGNTLRGLHSTSTRRYGRHACLLGSTSLGRRDLKRLLHDSSDEEQLVRDTLSKTNVLLSLNKQKRWNLPAIIGRMIQEGDFNKGAVVSMLERHKLKRKANCVNLISNNSRTAKITPKQKKYFSFSLDSLVDDESKREKRRNYVQQMKQVKQTKEKVIKMKNQYYQSIEAYTADGIPKNKPRNLNLAPTEKSEYRLEVFYPCPKSCSLTYNPKYTDVRVTEGKTGELEVKSNVKATKKYLSTHRKRLSARDRDLFCSDAVEDDVGEMWQECDDEDDNENGVNVHKPIENTTSENIIEMLLVQAQKTKDLCIRKKGSNHSKTKRKTNSSFSEITKDKSHIVFIENEDEDQSQNQGEVHIPPHEHKEIIIGGNATNLEFFRVILKTSEISTEVLRQKYGSLYAEASCQPRRFILNVTEDVTNLLANSKASSRDLDFSSYLVCVFDGFYDDGLVAYKVTLNSMVVKSIHGLSDIVPFALMSIPEIMNVVASHLLDLKEQDQTNLVERNPRSQINNFGDFVNRRMKLKVEVFDPSQEMSRMLISDETDNPQAVCQLHNALISDLDEDLFCDVCYASVTSSRIDSVCGTKLNACGHLLCDECWASHFRTCIKEGKTVMSCGGYECNTSIGPVTLMSILNVSEIAILCQRQAEEKLETMDNAKWCPFPGCGQVIKIDSKYNDLCVDVICACGNKLCFSCFGPAHWPAKCEQAEEYLDKLPNLNPVKEYVEEKSKPLPLATVPNKKKEPQNMIVEGRLCPRCRKFIEKNGGCSYMVCKCGYSMCWECMRAPHDHSCKPDPEWMVKHKRILIVRHTSRTSIPLTTNKIEDRPKIEKNKQKASLCQRALQQREEGSSIHKKFHCKPLIMKMTKAASQDKAFKLEIMKALSVNVSPKDEIQSLDKVDITHHIKRFLYAFIDMKQELHHVTEFTFILLQDTPHSVAKQRILKLANDLSGVCSFVRSILELPDNQDVKAAFRRLVNLQEWANRALGVLISATKSFREE